MYVLDEVLFSVVCVFCFLAILQENAYSYHQ